MPESSDNPFKEGTYGLEPGGSYDRSRARGYMSDMYNTSTQGYQGKIKRQGQEATEISDVVPRLPEYAKPGEYRTQLDPKTEQEFQQWVVQNKIPFDPKEPVSDYDMRGYFQALKSGDPKAKQQENQNDGKMHFPDYWKTPYHKSFSAESQWADPIKAPRWNSKDQLVTPDGKVVYDERKEQTQRVDKKAEENKSVLKELKSFLNKHGMPADVDQLLSGDYPLGLAAVGKAMRQLHDMEQKKDDK